MTLLQFFLRNSEICSPKCVAAWENPPHVGILTFSFFYISIKFKFLAVKHFLNFCDNSFRSKIMSTFSGVCQKTQKWENRLQSWTFQTFHFMPKHGFIIQNHVWCVPMISHIEINITRLKRTSWALISCAWYDYWVLVLVTFHGEMSIFHQ